MWPVNVPDFNLLAQLAECLSGSGLHANWAALSCNKSCTEYQEELQHCVNHLVEVGRYQQGLDFVTLLGLPRDSVVIAQVSIPHTLNLFYKRGRFFGSCLLYGNELPNNLKEIEVWGPEIIHINNTHSLTHSLPGAEHYFKS
jgi:hypothetical protein